MVTFSFALSYFCINIELTQIKDSIYAIKAALQL